MANQPENYFYKPYGNGVKKITTGPTPVGKKDKINTEYPLFITLYIVTSKPDNIHHIHAYVSQALQFKVNIKAPITTEREVRRKLLESFTPGAISERDAIWQFNEWLERFSIKPVLCGDMEAVLLLQKKLEQYTGGLAVAKRAIDFYSLMAARGGYTDHKTFKMPTPTSTPSIWAYSDTYIRNPKVL